MPIIEIETALGEWIQRNVSHEERRQIVSASPLECRFICNGVVYLAHPSNPWCYLADGDTFTHFWNYDL